MKYISEQYFMTFNLVKTPTISEASSVSIELGEQFFLINFFFPYI